ncbi:MAG TPA: ATP-binding protein [Bryobacteraceae bacterium]|nr:ATP-binding protein [Bryobacteraceae bacterium]
MAATLAPLMATVWITTSLLDSSLDFSATGDLETLSQLLQTTGRELRQRVGEDLKRHVRSGEVKPQKYLPADRDHWPEAVKEFADSDEAEQFAGAGQQGDELDYLVRHGDEVWLYSTSFGEVKMDQLRDAIRHGNRLVSVVREHDLKLAFKKAYLLAATVFWLASLSLLVYSAHRVSSPIQQLTAGLSKLASGDLSARVENSRDDEIGRAIQAFNSMAGKLQQSTERLVYLRQLASWQTLARKMAHEVKNSLTPIRLTVEEMLARYDEADRGFMEQATQIVVDEIETLERRVRAFSQFAAEPPVVPSAVDVNSILQERIAFLKTGHPEVSYECRLEANMPPVTADQDLIKGILTNLLENAADAAGAGGHILGVTAQEEDGRVAIEVHDSGPGLSDQARASLFQPTISFKKKGMGLGLSIARKSALLSGGDIVAVKGELGGAGFRVLLPVETNGFETRSDRG